MKNKILNQNIYALMLKILGIGFLLIGISVMILIKNYNLTVTYTGMSFGIIFIGLGEVINLLQKIVNKK